MAVCRMTPVDARGVAVRRIAPTLCGSSMPSSTTSSGALRRPRRRDQLLDAVVARALDLGDDALVDAAARRAIERLRVDPLDGMPAAPRQREDLVACACRRAR